MKRHLCINIYENPTAMPGTVKLPGQGRTGTDPGEPLVMPPIDDPGEPIVMPPIDDPGEPIVMPPIDDPYGGVPGGSGGYGYGYGCGCGNVTVSSGSCCCGCCSCDCGKPAATSAGTTGPTPHPFIAPRDFSGFVIVRTAPGIDPNAASLWDLANRKEQPLPGLKAVLELPFREEEAEKARRAKKVEHLISRPLVELRGQIGGGYGTWSTLPRGECIQHIRDLEKATALTAFPPLHSLTTYWRLDLRDHPGRVEEVVAALNRLAEVDLAYRELAALDPQAVSGGTAFAEDQGYLDDAPLGISASWAWERLANAGSQFSQSIRIALPLICDLEQGWDLDHDDLAAFKGSDLFYGANRSDAQEDNTPHHHGTAVLGQVVATRTNPFGVKGAATGFGRLSLASHYLSRNEQENGQPHPFAGTNGHVAAAVTQAVDTASTGALAAGDILLLEVQRGLLPTEVDEADLDAIRLASGLGVIVVEAAGNGGFDLDAYSDTDTGRTLRRGDPRSPDSGAILVGAALASLPHDRAPFSNYGSRLDCFGWGANVTTTGYGNLAGTTVKDFYTNSFSGTSSASPIVAGAAALLQSLHLKATQSKLEPRAMRALLSDPATGTRQGPNVPGHIGVMPDLRAIVNVRLQLVPVVYMRRSVCDDGSTPGPDEEISSSPDLFFWPGALNKRYDEGNGRENLPAPGKPYAAGLPLYVRLRNRGLGLGEAYVHIFASPAATLITPERWIPWGLLDVVNPVPNSAPGIIPQGDTLFVAGPINPVFTLTSPAANTLWSFLAVLIRPGENGQTSNSNFINWMACLPPTAPYFDWTRHRAFLRRRGVAWRNAHRVAAPTASTLLPFVIAGTPDRTRLFDFEVIQRLPEGATVTLQVPTALDAKLRQRQPWIGSGSLPARPRTAIRGVALPAGTYANASFTVQAPAGALSSSHSLAIRQLWHGEEVGRITWYFGLDT